MSRPVFQQVWLKRMIMRIMKRSKRSKIFSVSQWSETLYDNQHLLNYILKLELNMWILIDDVPESIQLNRIPDYLISFLLLVWKFKWTKMRPWKLLYRAHWRQRRKILDCLVRWWKRPRQCFSRHWGNTNKTLKERRGGIALFNCYCC